MKVLGTLQEYQAQIQEAASNPINVLQSYLIPLLQPLVVIDFTATWCGPCKMIAPVYEKMQEEFPGVVFAKIDVDANEEATQLCGVTAMPTFQFYKGGQKVGELKGANADGLRVSPFAPPVALCAPF